MSNTAAEAQPRGRFERIDGRVMAMAPEQRSHARRKARVWLALTRAVEAAGLACEVYPDGVTLAVDDNDFEPDAILRCGDALPGDGVDVPDPLVVVEVLSPSTRSGDLTGRMVAYLRLPSVRHYLIVWVDRSQVVHHRRRTDGEGIETRVVTAGDQARSARIGDSVEDVYAG